MNFEPKTEKQIEEGQLWKRGEYSFEIIEATDKRSKSSGNEMIELKVKVIGAGGRSRIITDYLLEQRQAKLRHASMCCGLDQEYEAGEISAKDFAGKCGKLRLGIEKPKDGFSARNIVIDYLV